VNECSSNFITLSCNFQKFFLENKNMRGSMRIMSYFMRKSSKEEKYYIMEIDRFFNIYKVAQNLLDTGDSMLKLSNKILIFIEYLKYLN
jgi:hypothetical protein